MTIHKLTKKTYKEQWIDRITKEILKKDKDGVKDLYCTRQARYLREIREKAKSLEASHFVPKRFPSAEFLSISLALRNNL
jgi:hypothetical protein